VLYIIVGLRRPNCRSGGGEEYLQYVCDFYGKITVKRKRIGN
jgi:hypothetical protein